MGVRQAWVTQDLEDHGKMFGFYFKGNRKLMERCNPICTYENSLWNKGSGNEAGSLAMEDSGLGDKCGQGRKLIFLRGRMNRIE